MVATKIGLLALASLEFTLSFAKTATVLPAPGQPKRTGIPGGFEIVGESLVSAQQLFLGTEDKVYFIDKVEDNPTFINGHPAWASEWSLDNDQQRAMEVVTNSFCAGGNVLGNGTWLNVGGNQPIPQYINADGRTSIRMLTPTSGGTHEWVHSPARTSKRWYPTLETLQDGTMIIIGGCLYGGYVNDPGQDNPTYEFFPPRGTGEPIYLDLLRRTLPANLYPLTWLLPSGKLLVQSNWATSLLDINTNKETPLADMPDAVRVYPGSAGSIMLPLTPENNYTATIMFCGGSNVAPEKWTQKDFIKTTYPASTSCVKITPDESPEYVQEDPLPEARVMVSLAYLPDGKIVAFNGAKMGTAGYGDDSWTIGHSYADNPLYTPEIYDPDAQPGVSKWSNAGLSASTVARMYHSTVTLLPDGSMMVSGSNPNNDYVPYNKPYPTEYKTEIWYPTWYNERRPEPNGLLSKLSYGGDAFDITLSAQDLFDDITNINRTMVTLVRPGFSTHAISMGQRFMKLKTSYTAYADNTTAVLHVSQLPPSPTTFAPGPALLFVVVNGVPSVGKFVMIGTGELGPQPTFPEALLEEPKVFGTIPGDDLGLIGSDDGSGSAPSAAPVLATFSAAAVTLLGGLFAW